MVPNLRDWTRTHNTEKLFKQADDKDVFFRVPTNIR